MKVVINRCYGGFSLSDAAMTKLGLPLTFADERKKGSTLFANSNYVYNSSLGIESDNYYAVRADSRLVAVVEELGDAASGSCASLAVVEIPEGVEWYIEEYDGLEHVAEVHRTWS